MSMAERAQSFKTHTRFLPAFHFFVLPVLLINQLSAIRGFWLLPTLGTAFHVILAAALLILAFLSRTQALTVQDRVIRLEMRLRLRQLLAPDLQARINGLSSRQLVALRFASDAELPELVGEVLDGRITTSKEIKMRVRNWQADWLRV
jgi:Family of unknown function (DUF6526)